MAKQVKRRRGTTAEHTTFAGVEGEISVDTDKQTIVVHNGTAPGKYLMREDASNMPANSVGIIQLDVTDGDAGDFLQTDGNDNLTFAPVDVAGSTMGAVGGDISGTISNALIRDNKVGVAELAVTEAGGGGSAGHFLKTDGAGTLSFAAVVTDPTMGGDVGGTTSASVIQTGAVEGSMLDPALKQFTEDASGEIPTGGYGGSAGVPFPAGDGTTTTYTLSIAAAANNALVVSIDGIMQPTQSYSLPTTTSIQFDDPPPNGSQIRILHIGFQVAASTPADGSVTTIKLGGGAVTDTKLASSVGTDAQRAVTTDHIRDNAVTAAKIATDTITANEIAAGTITGTQISNSSITGLDIQANAIDGSHISIGTDQGDMMYYNGTNWIRLAYGTASHVLTTAGANANPYWAAGSSGTALPSVGSSGNVLTSDGSNWASQPHASSGGVVNIAQVRTTTIATTTTTFPRYSLPTTSSGMLVGTISYTPASATNRLLITPYIDFCCGPSGYDGMALFAGTTCKALTHKQTHAGAKGTPMHITFDVVAGGTSAVSWTMRAGCQNAGTFQLLNDGNGASTPGNGTEVGAGMHIIEYTP